VFASESPLVPDGNSTAEAGIKSEGLWRVPVNSAEILVAGVEQVVPLFGDDD